MMHTRTAIAVVAASLSLAGCRRASAPDLGIPDTTFVATMTELRRAETDTSLDQTMRDSTRRLILRRHRVTAKQLENAARTLAQTPTLASDLWRKIESPPRINAPPHPAGADTGQVPVVSHPVPHV